jgi:hypothetical protein
VDERSQEQRSKDHEQQEEGLEIRVAVDEVHLHAFIAWRLTKEESSE